MCRLALGLTLFRCLGRSLISDLDISCFPAGCLHGAIIYDKDGNIEKHSPLDPTFVLGVTELMKSHNKTTMLYVADWVAMASLEQGGKTDWEAVSRGFDPCVEDARGTDFLEKVTKGEEKIGKIFLPMDEEEVPKFLDLLRSTFPTTPFKTTRALPYIIEIGASLTRLSPVRYRTDTPRIHSRRDRRDRKSVV